MHVRRLCFLGPPIEAPVINSEFNFPDSNLFCIGLARSILYANEAGDEFTIPCPASRGFGCAIMIGDFAPRATSGVIGSVIYLSMALTIRAETLSGALINAYQHNPQLNSQRAVTRATDEQVPQALSGYKPTISATLSTSRAYTSQVTKETSGSPVNVGTRVIVLPQAPCVAPPCYPRSDFGSSPSAAGLTISQTLFNGFQTANRVRQADSNTSAAREALRATEQTVLLNAATAYMDLLRDGPLLELQRRNVEVLQEQLRQTRDRFDVGEVTRTDIAQTEAQLAQGRATVLSAEAQYVRSRANYRQFIGVEAATLQPAAPVDRLSSRDLITAIEIARVFVQVPQGLSAGIRDGLRAELYLPQYPDKTFNATVATTARAINITSRTLLVELHAENTDELCNLAPMPKSISSCRAIQTWCKYPRAFCCFGRRDCGSR